MSTTQASDGFARLLSSRFHATLAQRVVQAARHGCHCPLIPLCAGFVIGCLAHWSFSPYLLAGIALLVGIALATTRPSSRYGVLAALCGLVLIGLGFGIGRSRMAGEQAATNPLMKQLSQSAFSSPERPASLAGMISSPLHLTPRGAWLVLRVSEFTVGGFQKRMAAGEDAPRVFVSLPSNALQQLSVRPQFGDGMQVEGLLSSLDGKAESDAAQGWSDWLRTQTISATLMVKPSPRLVWVIPLARPTLSTFVPRLADRFHVWCDARMRAALPAPEAALAGGVLLGERSGLSPAQTSAFAATGCAHLLATAGLHVGILALVLETAFRWLTAPRKLSAVIIVGAVWLYALAAGDRAAVERAACVATLYYGALLLERMPDLLSALALCALAMLWQNPLIVQDIGFEMSFCTVIGLIIVMPALMQCAAGWTERIGSPKLRHAAHRLVELECLAVAAQAVAAPLVAAQFNQVSCLGVFANLLVCPLMFLILPSAIIGLAVGAVSGAAGIVCLRWILGPLVQALFAVIHWFALQPGCSVSVATPSVFNIALYYLLLFAVCALLRPRQTHESRSPDTFSAGGLAPVSGDSSGGKVMASGAKQL